MINLVKNELIKIFSKKSIFIVLIITLVFMIAFSVLEKIVYNEDIFYFDDTEYLKQQLNTLDKNNEKDRDEYCAIATEIQSIELAKNYDKNSWQRYVVDNNAQSIISTLLYSEGTEDYEISKKAYDEFISKLDNGNWRAFAEDELKDVNKQVESSNLKEVDYLKYKKQTIEWRLEKNIPYGNSFLNELLQRWISDKEQLRIYEENAKTKELDYEEKVQKQQMEGEIKLFEYAIQNDLYEDTEVFYINNQTSLATKNDGNLVEVFTNYSIFIIISIVIIAGTIISEEYNKGTIKLLLVRPYSRTNILFAKFVSCLITLFIIYICLIVFQFIIGVFANGFNNYQGEIVIYNFNTNVVEKISTFGYLILTSVLILPLYILILTLAFSLSIIFNSSAVGIALPILGMLGSEIINNLAYMYEKAKFLMYFITPNWDFRIYLFGRLPQFEPISLPFSIGICVIYFAIMLITSIIVFRKKEVKNI